MNLLREYIRGILLTEAAKSPADLTDDMRVVIQDRGSHEFVVRLVGVDPDRGNDEYILGNVTADKGSVEYRCNDAFIVSWSGVEESGWGPLLYDVAMEYATSKGSGLMADRTAVSSEAFNVWQYYADQRGDVEKFQMDDAEDNLTPGVAADNCGQASVYADPNLPGSTTRHRSKWNEEVDGPWDPRGKDILLKHPLSKMYRSKGTPKMKQLKDLGKLSTWRTDNDRRVETEMK